MRHIISILILFSLFFVMFSCSKDPTVSVFIATPTPTSIVEPIMTPTPDSTPSVEIVTAPHYLTEKEKVKKFLEHAGTLNPIDPEWAIKKYSKDGDFANNLERFWPDIETSMRLDGDQTTSLEFKIRSKNAIEGIKNNELRFSWIGTILGSEAGTRYAATYPMSKQDYDIYKSSMPFEDFQDFITKTSTYIGLVNVVDDILNNQLGIASKNITDNDKEMLLNRIRINSKTLTFDKYIELNGKVSNYLFGVEDFKENLDPKIQKRKQTEDIVKYKIGYNEAFNKFLNIDNKLVSFLDTVNPGQSKVLQTQFENAITDYLNENNDLGLTAEIAAEKVLETWGLTPTGDFKPYPRMQ